MTTKTPRQRVFAVGLGLNQLEDTVALDAPVGVVVRRPDLVERDLALAPTADGTWEGTFTDTGLVGPYLVSADVSAPTPLGNRVTRFRQLTGLIFRPGGGDGGGGGHDGGDGDGGHGGGLDPEECREARLLLKRLAAPLERCCCRDREPPPTSPHTQPC